MRVRAASSVPVNTLTSGLGPPTAVGVMYAHPCLDGVQVNHTTPWPAAPTLAATSAPSAVAPSSVPANSKPAIGFAPVNGSLAGGGPACGDRPLTAASTRAAAAPPTSKTKATVTA